MKYEAFSKKANILDLIEEKKFIDLEFYLDDVQINDDDEDSELSNNEMHDRVFNNEEKWT